LQADHLVIGGKKISAHLAALPPFPGVKFVRRHHNHSCAHLVMTQAAQFGTRYFIGPGHIRLEVQRDLHARHKILLDSQFSDEEAMNHVKGAEREAYGPSGGYAKDSADDIVFSGGVCFVQAEGIAGGLIDKTNVRPAEAPVSPWVSKIPRELPSQYLYRLSVKRCWGELNTGPGSTPYDKKPKE
jgi:hypothetical protein